MKSILSLLFILTVSLPFFGQSKYQLTKEEQNQILKEAEDWIDDMPEGLQDRLSDAVLHSLSGFFSELYSFRGMTITNLHPDSTVLMKDLVEGNGLPTLRLYQSKNLKGNKITPLLVYFHGGGWTLGSTKIVDAYCSFLASSGKVRVVSVDYPLSPENKYLEILSKCFNTINFIIDNPGKFGTSKNLISLGGDGAGGNLVLNLMNCNAGVLSKPGVIRSLILYYPLTGGQIHQATNMRREYGRGYGLDGRLLDSFYLSVGSNEKIEEGKNPTEYDSLAKVTLTKTYPPILMIEAGRDIIIEQEKDLQKNLGGKVTTVLFEGAIHGFISDGHQKTALRKAVELSLAFLTE